MPNLTVGDNVLMTINGTLFGQRIMNTFGYVVSEMTGAQDQLTAFQQLRTLQCTNGDMIDAYYACCPIEYSIDTLVYQVIRPTRFQRIVLDNLAGGDSSIYHAYTANLASVLMRRGSLGNRKNVSTLHIPAPSESGWATNGILQSGAIGFVNGLGSFVRQTYTIALGGTKFSPSILNGPLSSDVTPIVDYAAQSTMRVMRRRTVGLGI